MPDVPGDFWVLALNQTAARGRRGREWQSPDGNFSATLIQRGHTDPLAAAQRSFVAALALREALVAVTGREDCFALKWPNDVLLRGGKLAGILLESGGAAGRIAHLAVGIGVNLASPPASDQLEATAVAPVALRPALGCDVTPEAFLDLLAPAFARWDQRLRDYGFGLLREAWLQHAARLGEVITARTSRETHVGTFETLDEAGQLVLITSNGRQVIPAADVYF